MSDIIVYTAITGNYEHERNDIVVFNQYKEFISERRNAKIYKVLPHLFLDNEITIWLDGNISFAPNVDIEKFVDEFLGYRDIAFFMHPYRDSLKDEAETCITLKLDDEIRIRNQVGWYFSHGPVKRHLLEAGVIVRRNTDMVNTFNEKWWAHICRWSSRDQISLPYVLSRSEVNYIAHPGNVRSDSRFIYKTHRSHE